MPLSIATYVYIRSMYIVHIVCIYTFESGVLQGTSMPLSITIYIHT
jgi:hypothetical protein